MMMGVDYDFASSYAKAQIAAGQKLPMSGACCTLLYSTILVWWCRWA
jgi:hypothetical protein